ncbi:MAG: hypothetical protein PHG97_02890 [Candidatus Margulisbacteria bacterium]|nr:hypothetical protein [Candidatus Margulisiibacteriota bacterium]
MDPVSAVSSLNNFQQIARAAAANGASAKVSEEFLTIFYKEMLKQAVKSPALSYDPEKKDENSFFSAFNTDIMIEQFAKQLAKDQIARPGWLPAESK